MLKAQVIGFLGNDATVNMVNGKSVINFSVAHSERFKDAQGNQKDKTTWVDCNYWTDRTAIAPYLKKGTQVYAEGVPNIHPYTKRDGTQAYSFQLRVGSVQLLGSKDQNAATNNGDNATGTNNTPPAEGWKAVPEPIGEPIDDLPF